MKTKIHSSSVIGQLAFAALAALALCWTGWTARAQDTVTIGAADFQRLTYSAHLHTQLALKPELGACLQVLLEMQRRNPNADPAALAGLCSNALHHYRTNAPCYIRTNGYPDEILAAYLDGLRQLPGHTNLFPADLTLLNCFMLNQADYNCFTNETVFDLINSAGQRLSSCEGQAIKRQALVDNCVARAQGNAAFAAALESLLLPETQVSLADTPAAIIGNPNSPLHGDLTLQTLLALSQASSDGSVTVSSNQVMNLFTSEMQTIENTIRTNLAVLAEINQSQPDYLAYLTNQAAVDANVQFQATVQQGQPAQLACSTAAVLVQSKLLPVGESETAQIVSAATAGAEVGLGIGSLCAGKMDGASSLLSGGKDLFDLFSGSQSPQQQLANQISNVQTMMGDLSTNMNYRFDRVDQSLTTIYNTLNTSFSQIEITLGAQGQQIATLQGSVNDIRSSLVNVQAGLDRLESEVFADFDTQQKTDIIEPINQDLLYRIRHPNNGPISYGEYQTDEADFFTYAANEANDPISSPTFSPGNLPALESQLTGFPLDANLNYIQEFLGSLGVSTAGTNLANPTEWFIAADAYLQLAGENPMYFRNFGPADLYPIIAAGKNLTNFCGSLTFIPGTTSINWPLYTALENHYVSDLLSFNNQVSNTEYQFALTSDFNLGAWRQWDLAAPRLTAAATEVLEAPPIASIIVPRKSATNLAAGAYFSLALTTDGTVLGWGDNSFGQTTIPAGLTGVAAIAAGAGHSLALQANGTVMGWGDNSCGQTNLPRGLTNMAAIAAGGAYSLALHSNGTVAGWGDNSFGQTNIPTGLSNVAAVAAGADHSLALTESGAVLGWGAGSPGSSGYALSFDGVDDQVTVTSQAALDAYPLTISAWIKTSQAGSASTGIINKYSPGSFNGYQLFLVSGHIHAWYFQGGSRDVWGGGNGMDGGFVADGRWHHVAFVADASGGRIFVDGILTASTPWTGAPGPTTTAQPVSLGNYPGTSGGNGFYSGLLDEVRIWNVARSQAQIQADMRHSLTGTEPGLIAYWKLDDGTGATATNSAVATGSACNGALAGATWVPGWGEFGQATIPPGATNVMAIAAGAWHSLALLSNGTVVAWGDDDHGQTNVPPGLTNVVAVAAGADYSLALKADGTVVSWGANTCGQTSIPFGLGKVVAIAAGTDHSLAQKADGTVVAWGRINERQCLVPPALAWSGAIAAGLGHDLALKADGTVLAWGYNYYGQTNVPPGLTNVVAIAAGANHSLALQSNGTVVGWGYNGDGETTIPSGLSNVVAIASCAYFSLALKTDGTVVGWGYNGDGETTIPSSLNNVVAIAAGYDFSLALKADGTVVGWGDNEYGQTNIPAGLSNVVAIAAGDWHSLALLSNGTVVGWGDNTYGEATGVISGPPGVVTIAGQILTNVVAVAAGEGYSLALEADGTVVGWGDNLYCETTIPTGLSNVVAIAARGYNNLALKSGGAVVSWGNNVEGQNIPPVALTNVVAISAGEYHSLALMAGGTVVDWGMDYSKLPSSSINMPASLSNVVAVAAGAVHSLALEANGMVVGWGDNYYGEIRIPPGLSRVVAIAAGGWHSLALTSDGTVYDWGWNYYGDFGTTNMPAGLNNVVAIAAGQNHRLALKADGTVVGWGDNYYGEINIPAGLNNVVAIAAGWGSSLALKADGSVVGWGDNDFGQATGVTNGAPGVVTIAGQPLTHVVAIAAGGVHSLALKTDGMVVGWGDNDYGETTIPAGLSNVLAIAAGYYDSLFLTATNTGASAGSGGLSFITAEIPSRVGTLIAGCDTNTIYQMGVAGPFNTGAAQLSGDKALLAAVLQLGMPYTLERDGVLHGFLYGSQSLMDNSAATNFLQTQNAQLQATPTAPPQALTVVTPLGCQAFTNRLYQCLTNLQATGQPEIPRLVGHTLRLLNLLSDACTAPANSPPPALEVSSVGNSPCLLLYGEPYMDYTLQYRDSLGASGWFNSTITNLQDEQAVIPSFSASPQRFFRAKLPMPQ